MPITTSGISKHLIIGFGQIGTAINEIIGGAVHDPFKEIYCPEFARFDVFHICFPFDDRFEQNINYMLDSHGFDTTLVIVHSTVPVGTCEKHGWVHSPCRGIHPNLAEGIRTFTKFFGGKRASEAAAIFEALGIETYTTDQAADTEAMKLWDTTQYGWNIILEKEIRKYCEDNGVDFDIVYTLANHTYNKGYEKLGHPEYKKYILRHHEGKIGGHCVIPNLELLKGLIPQVIKDYNDDL